MSLLREGKQKRADQLLGVVTTTSTDRFPSKLRDRLVSNIQQVSQKDRGGSLKTSSVPCPKCNAPDMKFAELQLRSADEGATIFYSCSVCDHR
ncbi:Zinc finger, TFIIS-type [Niveomyces insectorum RCEF 264]|uniref:DNA-directed RNA polymerase I subunit RPA12 n=1 Tax=Niveomyces insectorum RCEF 264 TaxID=1081102 RepID=A0A167SFW7_9HYPO|nr:Zinc finger, TFIIS-type [Niveomyces insectorum RCEF 264]